MTGRSPARSPARATISCFAPPACGALGRTRAPADARQEAAGRGRALAAARPMPRRRCGCWRASGPEAGEEDLLASPRLGADVPACLLVADARAATGRATDRRRVERHGLAGTPVLLVNPGVGAVDRRGIRGAGTGWIADRLRPIRRRAQRSRAAGDRAGAADRRGARGAARRPGVAPRAHVGLGRDLLRLVRRARARATRRRPRSGRRIQAGGGSQLVSADPRDPTPARLRAMP